MIKFNNTEIFNFDGAIRGMRNPLESWSKSDSHYECNDKISNSEFIIGENDLGLMKKLINSGSDHSKFMRQIMVSVDIIAPDYYFKEFSTYKVGTVENSSSTIHKIMSKEFIKDMFSMENVHDDIIEEQLRLLNIYRNEYLKNKDKEVWKALIQLLPMSFNYTRTCTLNYAVLRNMYHSRKNHKLSEWSEGFVEWVSMLPYAKELIIGD